jgi:hypothetical protein
MSIVESVGLSLPGSRHIPVSSRACHSHGVPGGQNISAGWMERPFGRIDERSYYIVIYFFEINDHSLSKTK